jgi:hypothetical protein
VYGCARRRRDHTPSTEKSTMLPQAQLQDLRSAGGKRHFACGSMVLAILSVLRFLRSASAKTQYKRR